MCQTPSSGGTCEYPSVRLDTASVTTSVTTEGLGNTSELGRSPSTLPAMVEREDPREATSAAARALAHRSWAKTRDRSARTAAARAAADRRFEDQVDPDGVLSPSERAVRAESARKAFYASIAVASAQARRARKAG